MKKFKHYNNNYIFDDPYAAAMPINISIENNIKIDFKLLKRNQAYKIETKTRSINIFAIQHFTDEGTIALPKLKLKEQYEIRTF